MFGEKYFSSRYFNTEYFGPIITDDVTVRIVTYWSPQYFGVKYFSPQYFGRGLRLFPQLHEKEGTDTYGTITESWSIEEVKLLTSSDNLNVFLVESVPLFAGQFFFLFEVMTVNITETASMDKVAEWEDGLSINLIETATVGAVSNVFAEDFVAIRMIDGAEREVRAYYVDVPTKVDPGDFYKDYDR